MTNYLKESRKQVILSSLVYVGTMAGLGYFLTQGLNWPGWLLIPCFILATFIECWRPVHGDQDEVDNRVLCWIFGVIALVLFAIAVGIAQLPFAATLIVTFAVILPLSVLAVDRFDQPHYGYGDGYHPTSVSPKSD